MDNGDAIMQKRLRWYKGSIKQQRKMKKYLKYIWQFVSFLFVPQQGKHITEQAQSYDKK